MSDPIYSDENGLSIRRTVPTVDLIKGVQGFEQPIITDPTPPITIEDEE